MLTFCRSTQGQTLEQEAQRPRHRRHSHDVGRCCDTWVLIPNLLTTVALVHGRWARRQFHGPAFLLRPRSAENLAQLQNSTRHTAVVSQTLMVSPIQTAVELLLCVLSPSVSLGRSRRRPLGRPGPSRCSRSRSCPLKVKMQSLLHFPRFGAGV
eukprot:2697638-Prymnesium_polylepis.2